ncbi:hypothetical protein [Bacillus pinisoli]|uniref:hypothetical protein n=1 Tax=Bacillus pinisoli TaxID=2901866 RepID=UPI001FF412DE|nr:hypothetical protein [Bacillus pinisoli]
MSNKWTASKIYTYILTKLAGAGFILSLIGLFLLINNRFDLFDFSETLSTPFLWVILYGYGIFCSLVIDLLNLKYNLNDVVRRGLYIGAGFIIFLIQGVNLITIMAGVIGAGSAFLFYIAMNLSSKSKLFKYIFSIALPIILVIVASLDFTVKKHWVERLDHTNKTFSAEFDYFNGHHEIPIHVEKGNTLTFSVDIINKNGGGHGLHILDDHNNLVGINETNNHTYSLKAEREQAYKIVLKGDDLQGSYFVKWTVEE